MTPIVGYRVWRVRGFLRQTVHSVTGGDEWQPGQPMRARCRRRDHAAPQLHCTCGIYAVESLRTAERMGRRLCGRWPWLTGTSIVYGVLTLEREGLIVGELEGRPGFQFRARLARIVAFVSGPRARELADRYGVPVVPASHVEAVASEFGEHLRPPDSRESPTSEPSVVTLVVELLRNRAGYARTELRVGRAALQQQTRGLRGWRPWAVQLTLAPLRLAWHLLRAAWAIRSLLWRLERTLVFRSWRYGLPQGVAGTCAGLVLPIVAAREGPRIASAVVSTAVQAPRWLATPHTLLGSPQYPGWALVLILALGSWPLWPIEALVLLWLAAALSRMASILGRGIRALHGRYCGPGCAATT